MRTRTLSLAVITGLATMMIASTAMADTAAITLNPVGIDFTNGTWSLGWEFVANQNMTVTQLGFYDDRDNDLNEDTMSRFRIHQHPL